MLWTLLTQLATANTIDSVLVFTDRAEITRVGTSTCSNGSATINFDNLPIALDTKTLRADKVNHGSIIGVKHQTKIIDEAIDERVTDLLKQKDTLLNQQRVLNDNYTMYSEENQLLQSYNQQFVSTVQTELKANKDLRSKWSTGFGTFRDARLEVQQKMQQLQQELADIQRQIGLIDNQLSRLQVRPTQQAVDAQLFTKCTGTNTIKAELHYVVPSASWTPESDLFVTTTKGDSKIKLQVSAQIRQATGEDWTNAKITLTTAQPNLGAYALYPAPIRVNGAPNDEQRVMVQGIEDRSSLGNAGYSSNSATNVSIDDNGQSMQLSLPHRTTIISNGQSHWVPVDEVQTDGAINNVSIPRATPFVFETITFSNPTAYSLLGGSMHLYKNGIYLGDHIHETTAPGEKMEVSLGTIPHLTVERTTIADKRKTKTLTKSQQLQRGYFIQIQNNSQQTEVIEIREAIPLSKNEDISVVLNREETTGTYTLDKYKGFVQWSMKLEPTKKERVDLVYHIELPSDWQVR